MNKFIFIICLVMISTRFALAQGEPKSVPKVVKCKAFTLISLDETTVKLIVSFDKKKWNEVVLKSREKKLLDAFNYSLMFVELPNQRKYKLERCNEYYLIHLNDGWVIQLK